MTDDEQEQADIEDAKRKAIETGKQCYCDPDNDAMATWPATGHAVHCPIHRSVVEYLYG